MKIEIHEVPTGHLTELPEPVIEFKEVWVVTAIRRKDKIKVVVLPPPGKGATFEIPWATEAGALDAAKRLKHEKYAHIRVHKLEVA